MQTYMSNFHKHFFKPFVAHESNADSSSPICSVSEYMDEQEEEAASEMVRYSAMGSENRTIGFVDDSLFFSVFMAEVWEFWSKFWPFKSLWS
jgi:hypothetical protein